MIKEQRQFEDIAPYPDSIFHEKMQHLVEEPGFEHAVKWVLPEIDYHEFSKELLQCERQKHFPEKDNGSFP